MVAGTYKQEPIAGKNLDVSSQKLQISERIREAIRESGGNAVVSEKSGVPLKTVSNYTTGATEPKIVSLSQISQTCGVSLDWIATGKSPKRLAEPSTSSKLNREVLEASFEIAEEMFKGQDFSPEHRAKILEIIYEKGLEEKEKD